MPRHLTILLLLACATLLPAKTHVAERYDVRVRIDSDTTLQVSETVRFHFSGGRFTYVTREIRKAGTDRIFDVRAGMDDGPAHARVRETRNTIRVEWSFDAPDDSTHEFTLDYRVAGAIRKERDADVLQWRAIPDRHDYRILAGRIEVDYPENARPIREPEAARALAASHEARRSVFILPELSADRGAPVRVEFSPGFVAQEPNWQTAARERGERASGAWITGGLAGLIVAAGGWIWLWRARRSLSENAEPGRGAHATGEQASPPPAVAARLADAGTGVHRHVGTLFDLARRGVVAVRNTGGHGRLRRKAYEIQPRDLGQPLLPFEREVVRLVFGDDAAPAPREFSSFLRRLTTSRRRLGELLRDHMVGLGLVDAERDRTRRQWRHRSTMAALLGAGLAVLSAGLSAGAAASGAAATVYTLAGVAGAGAAIFLIGVSGLAISAGISPLTASGASLAARARDRRRWIAEVAAGRATASAGDFERWLPVAMAFGSGAAWVRRFRRQDETPLPEWFQTDESDVDTIAFFDFVSNSASTADASAGGGGDGGGSGGGSSSAG